MKNMNIIICDDRIDDRKNLSDLLSDYGEKKNYEFAITEYDSGEIDMYRAGVQIYSCFRLYSGGLTCSTPHIFPLHFPHFLVCGNIHNPDIGIVNVDLLCPFPVLFLTLMDYDFIHKCV